MRKRPLLLLTMLLLFLFIPACNCSGDYNPGRGFYSKLCNNGIQDPAEPNIDCGGPYCDPCPQSSPCFDDSDCITGFCTDGVCCDIHCNGVCEACVASLKGSGEDGFCGPLPKGTDPEDECPVTDPDSCSASGLCNGEAGCERYGSEVVCEPGICVYNEYHIGHCDGICVISKTPCDPYICAEDDSACMTSCSNHQECVEGYFCSNSTCLPILPDGSPCTEDVQCISTYCVDDVCCNEECDAKCMACSSAKKGSGDDGVCGLVPANTDPDNDCPNMSQTSCLYTGFCDGAGPYCSLYPAQLVCGQPSCTGDTLYSNKLCNGFGNCVANTVTLCWPYDCVNNACKTSCTSTTDCGPGYTCTGSSCVVKKLPGVSCMSGGECISAACSLGTCATCSGFCEDCSAGSPPCPAGKYCYTQSDGTQVCMPKKTSGIGCLNNNECLSGFCTVTLPKVCT